MTKFVAYGWSSQRSVPALRDQVDAALAAVLQTGWDGLVAEQRDYLDEFWDGADVEVDGDAEVQQAVRFGLFHVAAGRRPGRERAIAAKGLTGPGYDGHAFWDTEMFVLPVLTATAPDAAADALRWRHSTIDLARSGPQTLGQAGRGLPVADDPRPGVLGYWPAGTAAFHVNADIALAAVRYVQWTGDDGLRARDAGCRCWCRPPGCGCRWATTALDGKFHIDGVTGPDEYSAIVDDNVYTNLMAAAEPALRRASGPALGRGRPPSWRSTPRSRAAGCGAAEADAPAVRRPSSACTSSPGLHPARGVGLRGHRPDEATRCCCTTPYFDLYRKQVVKQADLVLAMHWCGDAFTRGAEGAQLRLLRGADGAGLLAVGLHPGGAGGRGRPPGTGARLPRARPR